MNEWPFAGGPGNATAAQVAMMAEVWLDRLPKRPRDDSDRAPHGKVDSMTLRQWKNRHTEATDGPA